MCQRYNQFIETAEFSIRVSPSHSYNACRAGLGWASGWPGRDVYAACSDYVGFLALGESATRSLVRGLEGAAQRFIRNATCPHTPIDPDFGFLYFFGVSMCGVAAPA